MEGTPHVLLALPAVVLIPVTAASFPPQNELKTDCPYMCAYKLVTVKFRWWGLQTKVENFIHRVKPAHLCRGFTSGLFFLSHETVGSLSAQQEKRIFTNFHRQLFCWIDKWVGLTMEDIRRMEEETQKELEEVRPFSPDFWIGTAEFMLFSGETDIFILFKVLLVK